MIKRIVIFSLIGIVAFACKSERKNDKMEAVTAQFIVDKAIETSGGDDIDNKEICFDFRGREYRSQRNSWKYQYHRTTFDKHGNAIEDVLSNEGFKRFFNDSLVMVPDTMANRYGNSVNSVHYFAYLPYGLNDKAVNKKLLGEVTIKEQPYYKLEVTFNQEGGGDDFDDVYYYWIHKNKFTVDYLAYEFHVNGGGLRFREAYNTRIINGIKFVDYKNYKPATKGVSIQELETLFEAGKLELLSKIELENIYVSPCSHC